MTKDDYIEQCDTTIASLRAEVERLTKERDDWFELFKACAEARDSAGYVATTVQDCICDLSARATAAEKSRDEAIAELNKALETLGQLRSDLQKAEEGKSEALRALQTANKFADEWAARAQSADREVDFWRSTRVISTLEARAQSAEASLAKLRENAEGHIRRAFDIGFAWRGALTGQNIEDSRAVVRTLLGVEAETEIKIDVEHVSGFVDSDYAIVECKAAIKDALAKDALRSLLDEPDKDQNNAKR